MYGERPPDYRLPQSLRLGPVRLQVSDLQRSLDYYESVLGLRTDRQGSEATLSAGGDADPLLHLSERSTTSRAPRRGERLGLYHFALLVPDRAQLGVLVGHLAGAGVSIASADHAVSEALYLWDPDGLGIEVYADRPRELWQVRGNELFMTTERLDLRSLLAAAGETPWTGLPPGTVVGHLHLHVGDLAEAEAFYHRAIGLDKIVWSYPGALFLSAGGYHHHLATNTWAAGAALRQDDEPGLLEWQIRMPSNSDVGAVIENCDRAGYAQAGMRVGEDYVVRDPWGTMLRIAVERA